MSCSISFGFHQAHLPAGRSGVKAMPWKWLLMSVLVFQLVKSFSHIRHVQYNISEGVPEGHTIGDLLSDSKLRVEFHSDIIEKLFFKPLSKVPANISLAQDSGMIVVSGDIDREKICRYSFVCDLSVDIAVQPTEYFRIIKVKLHIHDINDNKPTFAVDKFVTTLSETSEKDTIIQMPYAEDQDSLQYAVKNYRLYPPSHVFHLKIQNNVDSSHDVSLILHGILDFEKIKSYNLSLIAEDGGTPPESGSIQIVILIADGNDHIPEFDNSTYEISVSENIVSGSTLLRVRAHDRDTGLNAAISYSFSDRTYALYSNYFAVNNITGDILVRDTIDYEINHVFQLSVVARDLGPNSHSVDTTVIVRVLDQNDCTPEIDINTLNSLGSTGLSEIREESPVGTFVAHISVRDRDTGPFGKVQCNITNPNFSLSNLSSEEYQIQTAVKFDREVKETYIILVNCKDNGIPSNNVQQQLVVKVKDINDHTPTFNKQLYEASIMENYYEGQEILRVNASDDDSDENGLISYDITDKQYKNYFALGENNGILTTLKRFDREKKSMYQFFIMARDNGLNSKSSSAKVVIHILDVNDDSPTFSQSSYYFSILENEPVRTYVGSVSAVDRDSFANSQFTFRFVENIEGSFSLDTVSGELSTTRSLDREEWSKYHLVVEARDGGIPVKTSTAQIIIDVLDQNDNIPNFIFPNQYNDTVQIPNVLPEGYAITKVMCVDTDDGDNGLVFYHLVSGGGNLFKMNNTSGTLYTATSHKFTDEETFQLDIVAKDSAKPFHLANSKLYLLVNSSLILESQKQNTGILTGSNLKTVIIVAVILGFIVTCLLIVIIVVYRQKHHRPRRVKQQRRYDKFQVRAKPGNHLKVNESSQMVGIPTSRHNYAKESSLLDELEDYEYLRRPPGETVGSHLNYLLAKKEVCHHNDYHKPRTRELGALHKLETDQDSTYSGDGSNTDSGKGPSEEGDNSHSQGVCTVTLTPVLEEDQKNHDVISHSNYNTYRHNRLHYTEPQYGFHRSLPHTVISGIPKCKCRSCNTNRFRTVVSKTKDTVFPADSKEEVNTLTRVDRVDSRTSPDCLKLTRGCKAVSYQKVPVTYTGSSPHPSPGRGGEEEEGGSSTTSGSYVVDHHDLSDVMNDSHWDLSNIPQHSVV